MVPVALSSLVSPAYHGLKHGYGLKRFAPDTGIGMTPEELTKNLVRQLSRSRSDKLLKCTRAHWQNPGQLSSSKKRKPPRTPLAQATSLARSVLVSTPGTWSHDADARLF